MEITKGENANLAGMEPRCPKCGGASLVLGFEPPITPQDDREDVGPYVYCLDCQNRTYAENWRLADYAQFFRSPAPTPPLDVEAEKRITEIRERESKATKGPWKVYPSTNPYMSAISGRNWSQFSEVVTRIQGTTEDNPTGVANAAFMAHSRLDIPFLLEQISLLRRHIASPAPQLKIDEPTNCDDQALTWLRSQLSFKAYLGDSWSTSISEVAIYLRNYAQNFQNALDAIAAELESLDLSMTRLGDGEFVTGYQMKTGTWHRILGLIRGGVYPVFAKSGQTVHEGKPRDAVKWLEDMGYGQNGKFGLAGKQVWHGYEIKEILELFAAGFPESGRGASPAQPEKRDE